MIVLASAIVKNATSTVYDVIKTHAIKESHCTMDKYWSSLLVIKRLIRMLCPSITHCLLLYKIQELVELKSMEVRWESMHVPME